MSAAATEALLVKSDQDTQHPVYEFETSQGKFSRASRRRESPVDRRQLP